MNDTKETIQLTWAGENSGVSSKNIIALLQVLILVTMTEGEAGPGLTSDIYRRYLAILFVYGNGSANNGKSFQKITQELGENVYIRRENGLQRHQNQRDSKEVHVSFLDAFFPDSCL